MFFDVISLITGLLIGGYGHKYLAQITGAPSNLSLGTASGAIAALVSHGENAAVAAIGDAHDAAVAAVKG